MSNTCNQGCLYSRGKLILFTDADGATDINGLEAVMRECRAIAKNDLGCAIGSRKEDNATVEVRKSIQ